MLDFDVNVVEESKEEDRTTSYREFEKYFDKFDHRYFKPLSDLGENLVEKRIYKPRDEQQDLEFAGKMWCWFCKHTVEGQKNLMIHLVEHKYCGICKTKFNSSESEWFQKHMLDLHQFEIPTITFRNIDGTRMQQIKKGTVQMINKTGECLNFKCSKCEVVTLDQKRLEMHYIIDHSYCLKCDFELLKNRSSLHHWKIHEFMNYRPDAVTKCRFCALNLHSEGGWMACEHFADCDFTTEDMKSYRNHMSIVHEQIVDCELNKKTRGELFIFIYIVVLFNVHDIVSLIMNSETTFGKSEWVLKIRSSLLCIF